MRGIVPAVLAVARTFSALAALSAAGGRVNTTAPAEGTSRTLLASILAGVTGFAAGRYLG
jgi:hypothetical protein